MALKDFVVGRKDLYMMDPRVIMEKEGWNVRQDSPEFQSHIRMLADSIKELGVQQPLTIFMDGEIPTLTDGHCRLAACLLAISEGSEIISIPVRVEDRYASELDRVLSMVSRNSGRPLTPMELAEVAKKFMALGGELEDMAKKVGLGLNYLRGLLDFRANAPEELKKEVISGNVSQSLAAELVRKEGGEAAVATVKEAKERTGKEKVTKGDLPSARTDWAMVGPNLKKLLVAVITAEDDDAMVKAVEKAEKYLAEI